MDVLIVKLGALGDVINTLPLVIALKEQLGARIYWLVAPLSYPLLAEHEAVDQTILFDQSKGVASISALLRQIRCHHFDLVLDLQRILKSGLLCIAARGERKIAFDKRRCKELSWLFPFERIPASDPHAHMIHQYLEFACYLGIRQAPIEWRIRVGGHLPDGMFPQFVILNIGATKPANRWTADGFSVLARMVQQQHHLPCVLTGGREDAAMAERIQSLAGENVCNMVGKTSLAELIDLIDAAHAVVTCDTGPMHLAVALGKKVIALFGPSDHRRTGPFHGKVMRAEVDCAPCRRKSCSNPACMTAIRPEDVFSVLSNHLNRPVQD
ncbi:MAG: glycosyltransferase family 9 protein [Desulfobacteraceae bacterium]|nr:MAG: glycosyltransferase family 9 protein [Desulfobacteraceae bacterium]